MIKVKLDILAKKLGKSVTDIAEETGLNRNTITALFHNKVDGIKFETLEKICLVLGANLEDLLEIEGNKSSNKSLEDSVELYKQEGSIVPFTGFPWVVTINDLPKEFFKFGMGFMKIYYKEEYGVVYWDSNRLNRLAQHVYDNYGRTGKFEDVYKKYKIGAEIVERIYQERDYSKLAKLKGDELLSYFDEIWGAGQKFWKYSIFIDAFDPGVDQKEIKAIADRYFLSKEEIGILTTPHQRTFNNDRVLELLRIIKPSFKKLVNTDKILDFINKSEEIKDYMHNFDYSKSNYSFVKPITKEEVVQEIKKYTQDKVLFDRELERLENYESEHTKSVKKVLNKYKLKKNPLEFFSFLTYWREERKKVCLMSIYLYEDIFKVIEAKTGIPIRYLKYLSHEELPSALKGLIDKDVLKNRREIGVLVSVDGLEYSMISGKEATSVKEELDQKLKGEVAEQTSFAGQTACQGYAKGIAKIILDESQFSKLKDGEILVTGMTRPEFVPLMKIAAGIVTNEGGITCHAAIVSRELGKPCIIGTRIATEIIKDGDLVEVRANHGTVRIIK